MKSTSAAPFSAGREASRSLGPATVPLPVWKRALDLLFCFGALPVLAVCTLAAFVMTSITSPGPVFFRQERVGYKGRRFMLYKFRTMHVSADVTTHQAHFAQLVRGNAPMHSSMGAAIRG
jgi:lipopolysaccharide/colanic/teichoic acid biosynthesis glycosyltransferase